MSESPHLYQDSEREVRRVAATKKFNENGLLGVTAQDHLDIGSTPSGALSGNPEKTMADLMSDAQIQEWLTEKRADLAEWLSEKFEGNSFASSAAKNAQRDIDTAESYLKSIGRL